ncbi:hypothetical protein R9X47_28145 [Wukongibacter baidiensis]|uniref:hypothetical protein n=1 Tax=Wukongibacter baidiensis TaxID=1723361 RepID=UPI003D7F7716
MKERLIRFIIIFSLSLFLCSCTTYTNGTNETSSQIDPYFQEDALSYTDVIGDPESADAIFKKVFKLKSLTSHILYYSPGQYNFVVNFDSSVTSLEIDEFMSYFSNSFISMHPAPIGTSPYQSQLTDILKSEDKPFEKLSLRVYINDVKAFRYDYTFKDLKLTSCKYWENVYNNYTFKTLKSKSVEDFIKKNGDLRSTINIRKTFKNDGVIIVNVKNNKMYSDRYINKMKEKIENDLAPALEKETLDKYGTNSQYLGIVLQFEASKNIYQEYVYYNGKDEDKGWIDVNWMEHKFLSNYIQN